MNTTPTSETYAEIIEAFDHFNRALFNNQLEPPLFTLQRERRTYGYCSRQRFVGRSTGVMVAEIAMNPAYFAVRPIRATLSTLVHEMVHHWQDNHGKPGRGGYHNLEWAYKMESVGLMPSNTGAPGGKRTGDQMTHYIIDGGPFDRACAELLTTEFTLSWLDRYAAERPALPAAVVSAGGEENGAGNPQAVAEPDDIEPGELRGVILPSGEPGNRSNRTKYVCPKCGGQAWGKPGLMLLCAGRTVRKGKESELVEHEPARMAGDDE